MQRFSFNSNEMAVFRRLSTPEKVQRFLDDEIPYDFTGDGDALTYRSPRRVLRDRRAHCMEGALFAAAALRVHGHPPLLLDLEAVRDDDHVLALFRLRGHWGAVGKSNYSGLRFREPVYRTLRELAISYFEHYFNSLGEKTLRTYSRPLRLERFDSIGWMTSEEDLWPIAERLCGLPHISLLTASMKRNLARMDRRMVAAGRVGSIGHEGHAAVPRILHPVRSTPGIPHGVPSGAVLRGLAPPRRAGGRAK